MNVIGLAHSPMSKSSSEIVPSDWNSDAKYHVAKRRIGRLIGETLNASLDEKDKDGGGNQIKIAFLDGIARNLTSVLADLEESDRDALEWVLSAEFTNLFR